MKVEIFGQMVIVITMPTGAALVGLPLLGVVVALFPSDPLAPSLAARRMVCLLTVDTCAR